MKIGIITSGLEMLPILNIINNYNIEAHVYRDWNHYPYGDKNLEYIIYQTNKGIQLLEANQIVYLLLPPILELALIDIYPNLILPFFTNYILNHVLKYSVIGKLGFIGDYVDIISIENYFVKLVEKYTLTDNQQKIQKFQYPFSIRKKETMIWKYHLLKLSFQDYLLRKVIKHDLRYFKDASIDTLIPLNYGYFFLEKIIKSKINTNKIKFHGKHILQTNWENIMKQFNINNNSIDNSNKKVLFWCNGNYDLLWREKKRKWLISQGGKTNIEFNKI